jgi:peptidoglycan/LPS O-acetylase OafA/YrhL
MVAEWIEDASSAPVLTAPAARGVRDAAIRYRPDIDGLRAIAVLAVILYHAEIPGFSGGYVGVDVFFVISGYLITQLLAESAHEPLRRQLKDFYLRRARRILPALFVTSLIVAAAVSVIFLPWDLATFGRYLAATPVFSTNVAAWLQGGGYFSSKLVHTPLAHFWSIAVEEQFYLVYPLTFAFICRYLLRFQTLALMALAIASFAVCIWGSYHATGASYFLLPTRAWELLLGAVLASNGRRWPRSKLGNELLAASALGTLVYVTNRFGPNLQYPGWYALAPCVASALLIQTGRQQSTLVGKLLSLRPLVFTGLISYSLYLWHYPVLVIAGYYFQSEAQGFGLALLIASIYIFAIATWKWIELPVRKRKLLVSDRRFALWAIVASMVLLATGILFWKSDGLPWRFPPESRARGSAWLWEGDFLPKCEQLSLDQVASGRLCSVGPQDKDAIPGLVWGDSHAMVLLPAYEQLAKRHHMRLYFAVRFSCRPLVGADNKQWNEGGRKYCGGFNAAAIRAIRQLDPRVVILNAHWIEIDADIIPPPSKEVDRNDSNFKRGLRETLLEAGSSNRHLCVVLDVPEYKYDLPIALGVARKRNIAEDFLQLTRAEAEDRFSGPERDIRALAQQVPRVRYVDPKNLLCHGGSCIFESGGQLLYGDTDHLSFAGAELITSVLDGCFQDIAPADIK